MAIGFIQNPFMKKSESVNALKELTEKNKYFKLNIK